MSEEQARSEAAATLLFVDDEASILSALRRLFRPHGYRILTAEGGAQGLEILGRETVDLVISDMRMPQMDGAQFLEKVRDGWPEIVRILLTGYADVSSTIAAINRGEIYRYISKPWDDNDIVLIVRQALERRQLERENARLVELTRSQNEQLKELNAGLERKVAARTAELSQTVAFLDQAQKDLKKSFLATVRVFSGLMELRGGKMAGHARRVAELARVLGARLHLDEQAGQDLLLASLLHDIGKIGLPDSVIEKPFNGLSPEARHEVMKHPAKGQMVLLGVEQLKNTALLIRHHHEAFDGSGYPDRLVGMAIPLGARILAVANDYDALQMGTLVNRALKPHEAVAFIAENRGKRYDPAVADAFVGLMAEALKDVVVEIALRPMHLKAGMVLARELLDKDGYLLLAKGHVLDAAVIEQLQRMEAADGAHIELQIVKREGMS